jgi:dihydropteroate synthase
MSCNSFSDGGLYDSANSAAHRALEMVRQGATVVDIGGESTRPGAEVVDVQIEIDRVVSVIRFVPEKLALV